MTKDKIDPEVVAELVKRHQEGGGLHLTNPFIQWVKAPVGTQCNSCQSKNVERSVPLLGGRFSGSVRCKDCGHRESVMSHLAKTCFTVEPLPPGAMPVYTKDPDKS